MKKKSYENSKLKHQLRQYEQNGKQEVCWRLKSSEQVDYIRCLGYNVEETLYYVHTKKFPDFIRKKHQLLNDLHFAKCKGKSYLARKLSKKENTLLDDFGVSYNVLKHTIKLQRQQNH